MVNSGEKCALNVGIAMNICTIYYPIQRIPDNLLYLTKHLRLLGYVIKKTKHDSLNQVTLKS